jgi:2-haloacid dehalogenase
MAGSPRRAVQNDLSSPAPLPKAIPIPIAVTAMALSPTPRALFFDVFGTCVDWRSTVVGELETQAHAALNSATASLASRVRLTASDMTTQHWGEFSQQWRDGYKKFTRGLAADASLPWKSVDEHHLESLKELMAQWQISGLWDDEQLRAISLIWHRLDPWSDSAMGVTMLNSRFGKSDSVLVICC